MYKIEEETIYFEDDYNESFSKEIYIEFKNINKIIFGKYSEFNQNIEYIPANIQTIIFGDKFNSTIRNVPQSMQVLQFGMHFNQPICSPMERNNPRYLHFTSLPIILDTLIFGADFNQAILCDKPNHSFGCNCPPKLPVSLKILRFGTCFNKPLFANAFERGRKRHSALPNNLEYLEFGHCFNQPVCNHIDFVLPISLRVLKFGNDFNQEVCCSIKGHEKGCSCSFKLPPKLDILEFGTEFNQQLINMPNFKHLILGHDFNYPLGCDGEFCGKMIDGQCTCPSRLPDSVISLIFGKYSKFNYTINSLPNTIQYLRIGKYFKRMIHTLPFRLKQITLDNKYHMPIPITCAFVRFE